MILMKETDNLKDIHSELAECLLHILCDQKILVKNVDDYHLVRQMCTHIRPQLIGEKVNAAKLLSRLQLRSDLVRNNTRKISMKFNLNFTLIPIRYLMIWRLNQLY